jgi:large subunit ribosomal protein L2
MLMVKSDIYVAPKGIKVGQKITSGPGSTPDLGNALPLGEIPLGTTIS